MNSDKFAPDYKTLTRLFSERITSRQNNASLAKWIEPGGRLKDPESALNIYDKAYIARLTEALGETFEATWMVLGDDGFFTLCEHYIRHTGSHSYNLSDVGTSFAGFIADTDLLSHFPFLHDLALFERLFEKVFHQRRSSMTRMKLDSFQPQENTKFIFADGLQFFSSNYSVYSIWTKRKTAEQKLPSDVWSKAERLTIFRNHEGTIQIQNWNDWEFHAVKQLNQGACLIDAVGLKGDNEENLVQFFSKLFSSGLIVGFFSAPSIEKERLYEDEKAY